MSPESNVQEKLTVTIAPPPAALAADKKKDAKKRTEAENLIEGHAATVKTDKLSEEQRQRLLARQGRTGGFVGFGLAGLVAFWILARHGRFLLGDAAGVKPTLVDAYHKLAQTPWFFELTTRMTQFRVFAALAVVFVASALLIPGPFGRVWMRFAGVLGYVNTRIILALVFYLIFTPWALVMKVLGNDPLRRARIEGSYWIERKQARTPKHFKRMF